MKLINLTPHAIVILVGDATVTVAPSGQVARCAVTRQLVGTVEAGRSRRAVRRIQR